MYHDPSGPQRLQKGTSGTQSRLSMSFKFLYGVLEDMKVPYKAGDGVRGPGEPLGSFTKNFAKVGQQVPCYTNILFGAIFRLQDPPN